MGYAAESCHFQQVSSSGTPPLFWALQHAAPSLGDGRSCFHEAFKGDVPQCGRGGVQPRSDQLILVAEQGIFLGFEHVSTTSIRMLICKA